MCSGARDGCPDTIYVGALIMGTTPSSQPARIGIIGGGDIAHRTYVPLLKRVSDANVVAVYDRDQVRAAELVESLQERWPEAKAVDSLTELRTEAGVDAVFNLTPAVVHYEVTKLALQTGLDVYSEKPMAASVEDASDLIELAHGSGRLLLCAPGNLASPRFRFVADLIQSGRIGTPHLVMAQIANMGPATWGVYIGDPRPFYEVGPLVDQGVYGLHFMTGLLGPATKVQAIANTAVAERVTRTKGSQGVAFTLTNPDQMLIHLTFDGAVAHFLTSFAVSGTRAPGFEVHGTGGSLVFDDHEASYRSVFVCGQPDDADAEPPQWEEIEQPHGSPDVDTANVIEDGAEHFVACLNGRAQPILTPEHARHIVDIIAAVDESVSTGAAVLLSTTFATPE
jgi:predicted dehydrogenase